eukprot:CAMPEP_0184479200 /NCGR_PEP_ID=MMETSP0113_2-20130426/1020_1 /TAXON_ID=91329 /ORGANISM="Norrisiella sphaerica, Strain BC52" /LENGTH=395 /DNA_ID=CAMNT_0026857231 /DNA_START=87 /DNA_END=1271 /DNA_ORIENTATION=-
MQSDANQRATQLLAKLQQEADEYEMKIKIERGKVLHCEEVLNRQAQLFSEHLLDFSPSNFRDGEPNERERRILENQLSKSVVRLEEANSHNRMLRSKIDHFRLEKESFDSRYRKLKRELHRRKKAVSRIRDEVTRMDVAMRETEEEISNLKREIDRENCAFKEQQLEMKRLNKIKSIESSEKAVSYEDAFNKVLIKTGWADLHALIKAFIANEDSNYTAKRVEEELEQKRVEVEKYEKDGTSGVANHRRIIVDLDLKLQKAVSISEAYRKKYAKALRVVESLKGGIREILEMLSCDVKSEVNEAVNESNMMQYFGIIEERTNELLEAFDSENRGEGNEDNVDESESTIQSPQASGSVTGTIQADKLEGEDSDGKSDDEDLMPLSLDELRAKVRAN